MMGTLFQKWVNVSGVVILILGGTWAYDAINNVTETPSYEDFTNNYRNALEEIYAGYPTKDNLTGLYPNPKGSRIVHHSHPNFKDKWTIETDVTIFLTVCVCFVSNLPVCKVIVCS